MNFIKQALAVLQIALGIVPQVIDMVKAVEVAGNGPAKTAAVADFIKTGFELLPDDAKKEIGADKIQGFATKIIASVVSYLNAVGIFKK